jgi:hypothetical protein
MQISGDFAKSNKMKRGVTSNVSAAIAKFLGFFDSPLTIATILTSNEAAEFHPAKKDRTKTDHFFCRLPGGRLVDVIAALRYYYISCH